MPTAKIHLPDHFVVDRELQEPLSLQVTRQLQQAIDAGRLAPGTGLPSTRSLARLLAVSRNTVLSAYDELVARGVLTGRRGAGMYVFIPASASGVRIRSMLQDAQYPSCTAVVHDQDGNLISVAY